MTVLAADLDSSTAHSVRENHDDNRNWVHPALNLVGQWGRAFGGVEILGREGDNVLIEFPDADSALLCAAVVLLHTRALRESGRPEVSWEFRVAVATGDISDGPGPNTTGECLNIASKLTGMLDDDQDAADRVLLASATAEACSADLRALIETTGEDLVLEADRQHSIDAQPVRIRISKIGALVAVTRLLEGPAGVAQQAQV